MSKKVLLAISVLLVLIGILKPDLSALQNVFGPSNVVVNNVNISEPTDPALKEQCRDVVSVFKNAGSSRHKDGKRLGDLYADLATLIELEGENTVVKSTDEIRQANSLSGVMLRMNIKGDYEDLSKETNEVIVAGIGSDNIILNSELRQKATESFRALAWACYEGAK